MLETTRNYHYPPQIGRARDEHCNDNMRPITVGSAINRLLHKLLADRLSVPWRWSGMD